MAGAEAALDIETGGGEVLATVARPPALLVATEGWWPNVQIACSRLRPLGARVVAAADSPTLPFTDASFDLVVSRHPVVVLWAEIARVLRPGGTYLAQQIGPGTNRELTEFMMGPRPVNEGRSAASARRGAESAGLEVVDLRECALRVAFFESARWCTSCARCAGPCPTSRPRPTPPSSAGSTKGRPLRLHGAAAPRRVVDPPRFVPCELTNRPRRFRCTRSGGREANWPAGGSASAATCRCHLSTFPCSCRSAIELSRPANRSPPDRPAQLSWPGSPSSCCSRGCAAAA